MFQLQTQSVSHTHTRTVAPILHFLSCAAQVVLQQQQQKDDNDGGATAAATRLPARLANDGGALVCLFLFVSLRSVPVNFCTASPTNTQSTTIKKKKSLPWNHHQHQQQKPNQTNARPFATNTVDTRTHVFVCRYPPPPKTPPICPDKLTCAFGHLTQDPLSLSLSLSPFSLHTHTHTRHSASSFTLHHLTHSDTNTHNALQRE